MRLSPNISRPETGNWTSEADAIGDFINAGVESGARGAIYQLPTARRVMADAKFVSIR